MSESDTSVRSRPRRRLAPVSKFLVGIRRGMNKNHSSKEYRQRVIDRTREEGQAVTRVSRLGKLPIRPEVVSDSVTEIIELMAKYEHNLHLQRTGCHSLSNIAMEIPNAEAIMSKDGFESVYKAIKYHLGDWKLCWLACSAIWNLARPPAARERIGTRGVDIIWKIMNRHIHQSRVINTALGALSNLSLFGSLKLHMAHPESLNQVIDVMSAHFDSQQVLTSGCGLLANLAVFDEIANALVEINSLPFLLRVLGVSTAQEDCETLRRNVSAALSNLTSSDLFTEKMLKAGGMELLYGAVTEFDNVGVEALVENCIVRVGADANVRTTSLHMASKLGLVSAVTSILARDGIQTVTEQDDSQQTPLDFALQNEHADVVRLLVACGARPDKKLDIKALSSDLQNALQRGQTTGEFVRDTFVHAVGTPTALPDDLCRLIVTHECPYEMLALLNLNY